MRKILALVAERNEAEMISINVPSFAQNPRLKIRVLKRLQIVESKERLSRPREEKRRSNNRWS
jgi:hypothetical protein